MKHMTPREASARRLTVARLKSYVEGSEAENEACGQRSTGGDPATPQHARAEDANGAAHPPTNSTPSAEAGNAADAASPRRNPSAGGYSAGPATSGGGQGCAPAGAGLGAGPRVSRDKRLRDLTHAREKSYAILFAARHATPPLADVEIEKREDDWVATCEAWEEALAELIARSPRLRFNDLLENGR